MCLCFDGTFYTHLNCYMYICAYTDYNYVHCTCTVHVSLSVYSTSCILFSSLLTAGIVTCTIGGCLLRCYCYSEWKIIDTECGDPLCYICDVVIVDNYNTLLLLIGGMCNVLKVNCVVV